jgi:hypothetical protein
MSGLGVVEQTKHDRAVGIIGGLQAVFNGLTRTAVEHE